MSINGHAACFVFDQKRWFYISEKLSGARADVHLLGGGILCDCKRHGDFRELVLNSKDPTFKIGSKTLSYVYDWPSRLNSKTDNLKCVKMFAAAFKLNGKHRLNRRAAKPL